MMLSRYFLGISAFLLLTSPVLAQFQIKGGTFNRLHRSGAPVEPSSTTTTPQFAGMASTTGTSGALGETGENYEQYPSSVQTEAGGITGGIIVLRSSIGGTFASGVPRYSLGDQILPPANGFGEIGVVASTYWRARPVEAGEQFTNPGESTATDPDPLPPPSPYSYYYSPHAQKVFAHQPGQVSVLWVTQQPVAPDGALDGEGSKEFRFREEIFSVASGTNRPVRTIYWTERSFNGPKVNIPTGRIVTVNPVYNISFPENVESEFASVGVTQGADGVSAPPELRTLWFQNTGGLGQIHAFNKEGRVFIEYLGDLVGGGGNVHEFLGADIVEVLQSAPVTEASVNLGEEILAHDERGVIPENASDLTGSIIANLGQGNINYVGTNPLPDGSVTYHAEWENLNPDRVAFYWLEGSDAAISLSEEEPPGLTIAWPRYLNKYFLVWPTALADYHGVTVEQGGSTVDNSIQFQGGGVPDLVHQDDGRQVESSLDVGSQRLVVDFTQSLDMTNRTLLKFSDGRDFWYIRLFIQGENVLGTPAVPDPDGSGPLEGTLAVPSLADVDADGIRDLTDTTVVVGQRIERPSENYSIAGFISKGTAYHTGAYIDPFTEGFSQANTGAIIPINAKPGENEFTVWWFSEVESPSPAFSNFFVPSVSGRYTATYPTNPDEIYMASNIGSGTLPSEQAEGFLYFQNDESLPGFNPNEEHGMMLQGRAFALRDDLNITSGADYSSEPYLLLSYTDSADGRPSVRPFRVNRELDLPGTEDDILFDYPVTAGATIPSPLPLPFLQKPLDESGNSPDTEVPGILDLAPDRDGPIARYDTFTFQDRKGFTKVYRGPHDGGSPTLGMQFYYSMMPDFFIPGVSPQPESGTKLPYLRAMVDDESVGDPVSGTALTITYRPEWPEAVPELRIAETLALPKFGLPQVRGQSSVEVLYQQSIALGGPDKTSVTLHDGTRAKKSTISGQGLFGLPSSAATTSRNGKIFFQRLPPHLQKRFYAQSLNGADASLILEGEFFDEIAGEDYLELNVLSPDDKTAILGLVNTDDDDRTAWVDAIEQLTSAVETFVENPSKRGTYIVASTADVDAETLSEISDSDTAVDSYALTATGQGTGYVSLIFADGEAFTPEGDPVSVAIVRVADELYVGDMKVQFAENPLDEQVGLRHSGDFAARPDHYEFEWRYAPGGEIPPVYTFDPPATVIGETTVWNVVQNPIGPKGSSDEFDNGLSTTLPTSVVIKDSAFDTDAVTPGIVLAPDTPLDFSSGIPARIILSASLTNSLDGFVVYVNGSVALASNAPAPFENGDPSSGLSTTGLPSQFLLAPGFFSAGENSIEIALYSDANVGINSQIDFRIETVTKQDQVTGAGSPWILATGDLSNQITIGGSPTAPLGDPLLVMQDNAFTLRYRPLLASGNVLITAGTTDQSDVGWSDWMEPKLVPGWVKRVLSAINPFNQRVTDLFNNSVNTDVSVLTQAGTRWEGDIALNLDNINDVGLIEIYETVLNRARLFSVDNGYDDPGANNALLLAAGYLNDLYSIVGNEAFADAANPTISLDDQDTITEVNTSRFSFEGQVGSVLEEELALLRGRDDFLSTSVSIAPAYNRLYWNFTSGINSGAPIYSVNYNIKEKVGSSTADGIVDAADAQRMFPQAHGDAYGHYLTALQGYYSLLRNDNFTWIPRSETVLVLGQNVAVDYFDERKFAGAAVNLARTAEQVLKLTYRQSYLDDASAGWSHFRDGKMNIETDVTRHWGVDEWASRSTQGAYLNWISGNAMLLDIDEDPDHVGIEIVDRSTVPELAELASLGESLQNQIDSANARLNPLGLSPDAIAFDISPTELRAGKSHFEQIYDRALSSALNAKGSFDQAGSMTRLLRNQSNQIDDFNTGIEEQERAYNYQLVDIYGSPYTGDIGPGKTYDQGYDGPDTINWFLVDRPTDFVDTGSSVTLNVSVPSEIGTFEGFTDFNLGNIRTQANLRNTSVTVDASPFVQFSDNWIATPGQRVITGKLQQSLTSAQLAHHRLLEAGAKIEAESVGFERQRILLLEILNYHNDIIRTQDNADEERQKLGLAIAALKVSSAAFNGLKEAFTTIEASQSLPTVNGLANDATSGVRFTIDSTTKAIGRVFQGLGLAANASALLLESQRDKNQRVLALDLEKLGFQNEQRQLVYEFEERYRELILQYRDIAQFAFELQKANEEVRNVIAQGDRIQLERNIFRQRAAAVVQGYRTNDLTFRLFRNEALEQYRNLFDLASRYTYLAAKSYDYETGLLGTETGQEVFKNIVASRALGDLTGDQPRATLSTLGDAGLAGTMAQLSADFSVAEGRLGINNPDNNGTLFSLRQELFRIQDLPDSSDDDSAWQQKLEQHIITDLRDDADAVAYCRSLGNSDGGPVPGIVIPFSTTIEDGKNFFGLPLAAGDHSFTASNFATKIYSVGAVFEGYVGMDPYAESVTGAGEPNSNDPNALGATPYLYLIPVGVDRMLAPPLGDTGVARSWMVHDQALPLPYNLGASEFSTTQFFNTNGTLSEQPWILRKHQAFRAVDDPVFFYGGLRDEFDSARLVGRSVWNTRWKIVIPAYTLLNDEQKALDRFTASVDDIKIFLRTYSHSGN